MTKQKGNTKGSILINTKEYITTSRGESACRKILNNLHDTDAKVVESEIITTAWYPAPVLTRHLNTYDIMHGKGDFLSVVSIAEYIANKDLGPLVESLVN